MAFFFSHQKVNEKCSFGSDYQGFMKFFRAVSVISSFVFLLNLLKKDKF